MAFNRSYSSFHDLGIRRDSKGVTDLTSLEVRRAGL